MRRLYEGYIVWSGVRNVYGVMGFRFIVQSSVKDPAYIDDRIEEFMTELRVITSPVTNLRQS